MGYNARPNRGNKYKSGSYNLINENKYISDPSKIFYRSGLEYKFCLYVDKNPKVLRWGSETVGVPYSIYNHDLKKNTNHTYWVDYYVEVSNPNSVTGTGMDVLLVEVKPEAEYLALAKNDPPPKPKNITAKSLETWEYNLKMFIKNKHKWVAAQEYARQKHMQFVVVTEKVLNRLIK